MKNKFIKKYCILLSVLGILIFSTHIYADSSSIDPSLQPYTNRLINLQKQFSYIAQTGFVNFASGKSNESLLDSLSAYNSELNIIINDMNNYIAEHKLSNTQIAKFDTLQASGRYLSYLSNTLSNYLTEEDPLKQYEYLTSYIKADALLTQLFVLFNS